MLGIVYRVFPYTNIQRVFTSIPCHLRVMFVSILNESFDALVSHIEIGSITALVYRHNIASTPNSILLRYAILQWLGYKRSRWNKRSPVHRSAQSAMYAAKCGAAATAADASVTRY